MEVARMAAEAVALRNVGGSVVAKVVSAAPEAVLPRVGPTGPARPRVSLNGALIDQVDFLEAKDRLRGFLASGTGHQIVTVNLDFLSIAERDAHFRDTINRADLAVADGMPLVWASRLTEHPLPGRITGVDLVDACCQLAAERGGGVFLLGAAPGVADVAGQQMEALYPGLRVVGTYAPPFGGLTPHENERIVRRIQEARPSFLFVAMGAPRQDVWIRAHLPLLDVPVCMGVGCTLDLLAGNVSRAPAWMQHTGLEWAFRLGQEPRRLWRRYIMNDVPTLGRLVVRSMRDRQARAA
jgi:N-acetylglucosaminyldiphosphoundecaprenol N-acetyl-beta-D-mannosaminyltransferase